MAGLNKVMLIGNVGQVETKVTPSGLKIANLSLATSYKSKEQEVVEWHKITAFDKVADIIEKYVHKGKKIYIEGMLKTDKYEKDGETRYSTKIIANQIQLLSPKDENAKPAEKKQDYSEYQAKPSVPFDDDIPF